MGGTSKNINSGFFGSYFVPFCYAIKRYSLFVTHSKMARLHSLTSFYYYLFIFFLVFIPGITQTRLPAALEILRARPGGGGGRGSAARAEGGHDHAARTCRGRAH